MTALKIFCFATALFSAVACSRDTQPVYQTERLLGIWNLLQLDATPHTGRSTFQFEADGTFILTSYFGVPVQGEWVWKSAKQETVVIALEENVGNLENFELRILSLENDLLTADIESGTVMYNVQFVRQPQ